MNLNVNINFSSDTRLEMSDTRLGISDTIMSENEMEIERPDDLFCSHDFSYVDSMDDNEYIEQTFTLLSLDSSEDLNSEVTSDENVILDLDATDEQRKQSVINLACTNVNKLIECIKTLSLRYEYTQHYKVLEVLNLICESEEVPVIIIMHFYSYFNFYDKLISYLKIKLDKNEYFLVENATLIWNFIENYFEKVNKDEINKIIQMFLECKHLDNKFKYNCIRYSILLPKTNILIDFINTLEPGVYLIYCLQLYKSECYFDVSFLLNMYEIKYKELTFEDKNENNLADFADFLLTIDNIECYNLGKSLLEKLGKYNDLYNSKQNIHMLNININEFVEFLKIKLSNITLLSTKSTFEELRMKCITNNQLNALDRIEMDNSRLQHVELSQLLNVVYNFIINSEHKEELLNILLSEFEDMSGTCTTGHYYRLVNVLSGYYNFVSTNPVLELRSVIKNRLTKCIESEESLKDKVVDAMIEKDENKLMILLYVYLEKIKNEMFKEYNNIITFEKIEEELRNVFISYTLDI
jgi:hypothetical protein